MNSFYVDFLVRIFKKNLDAYKIISMMSKTIILCACPGKNTSILCQACYTFHIIYNFLRLVVAFKEIVIFTHVAKSICMTLKEV